MNIVTNGLVDLLADEAATVHVNGQIHAHLSGRHGASEPSHRDVEFLRRCAWEIGETHATEAYTPMTPHLGLAVVTPSQGFAHWRILPAWVDHTAWQKGNSWRDCRLVLRLYDVSMIHFNGFNAHHLHDLDVPGICGQFFFKLHRPGSTQLGEVGFLLRNGEFVPAARSQPVAFPLEAPSTRSSLTALLVDSRGRVEEIGNVWDQDRILRERRHPRLRRSLRTAAFAFASLGSGQEGWLATFVSELAAGQAAQGHETHVFVPASDHLREDRLLAGVHYHPLDVRLEGTPLERAETFRRAAQNRLQDFPLFDLIHLHEWMTGIGANEFNPPIMRSISSLEITRRNQSPPSDLSREIDSIERDCARSADCLLTPDWLRDQAIAHLGLEESRVRAFPMEGRLANEWEVPLDYGQVKMSVGFGPLDRLVLYIGPLEHGAGVDLLLEALPVLLRRWPELRMAYVGAGNMYGHLQQRAHQLGVPHALRLLGHVQGPALARLLRSAEALVLPSRYRIPLDDAVVGLARRAGRPVVTTHGGPAHLIRHEETGLVTYDNPGSLVWALDRIMGDPAHAERMGNSVRPENGAIRWSDVARCYLQLCAELFPQLTETTW